MNILTRALILSLLLGLNLNPLPLSAQDAAAPAPAPATTATPSTSHAEGGTPVTDATTLVDLFKKGGWIMFPLALISMWCMALIIEGFIRIRVPNFTPADIVIKLKNAFAEENYQQAWRICKSKSSFLTNTLRRGLERIGRGRVVCETAIAEHSIKESMLFRTKISYLSTIGVISPMVGLLGTVSGMINAFQALGQGGIADPSKLAAAIGEVLVATATGLMLAIPAFFLYYFFRNRLQRCIVLAEDVMNQLMMDVKYEELQGLKIGEEFENTLSRGPAANTAGGAGKQVSQAIMGVTMACPQCNAPIRANDPRCNACGTELQWNPA